MTACSVVLPVALLVVALVAFFAVALVFATLPTADDGEEAQR